MAGEKGYDPANFVIGSGIVSYKETVLGGTDGPVEINREDEFYDSKCDQAGNTVLGKRRTAIKYTVKAKFKEIGKILPLLTGGGSVSMASVGEDIYKVGGVLKVSVVGEKQVHTFPKAVVLTNYSYALAGTEEHGIEVTFEAVPDDSGAIHSVSGVTPEA